MLKVDRMVPGKINLLPGSKLNLHDNPFLLPSDKVEHWVLDTDQSKF